MAFYDYYCAANKKTVEVKHSINERLKTWGEVCKLAGIDLGDVAADSPVDRIISAPEVTTPTSDSTLREKGFTKLVKKDQGVYEDVTQKDKNKRIVKTNDPKTYPDFKKLD